MHEHTFIEAILSNVKDLDKVEKLVLEVGDLAGIDGEHLKEHLKEMVEFEVEVVGAKGFIRCECGFEGLTFNNPDLVLIECPVCHCNPEVLEGKDIKIVKVVYA